MALTLFGHCLTLDVMYWAVFKRTAGILLSCLAITMVGHGADLSWITDFTSDTPTGPQPSWMQTKAADKQKTFADAAFEITPPPETSDLLVTVTFDEQPGGFLRVFWKDTTGAQTLSDNLYEGIDMPNQRSFLVPQMMLREKGVLTFQSSQDSLHIYKIHWQWMEPKVISATGDAFTLAAINANGKTFTVTEVDGNPVAPVEDRWKDQFITASLTEKPERIEEGVEFESELEAAPTLARLEGWFSGLPLDKNLTVWVNGRCRSISLEVPDLTDPGYQSLPSGGKAYVGWRKAQLWVPADWFQAGVNKVQFSWGDESQNTAPVSVKDLDLQLSFTPVPTSAPVQNALPSQ